MAETFPCENCGKIEGSFRITPTYAYYVKRNQREYIRLCGRCASNFEFKCWNCGATTNLRALTCCLHNVSGAEVGRIQSKVRASEPQWSPLQRQMLHGRIKGSS